MIDLGFHALVPVWEAFFGLVVSREFVHGMHNFLN
jgi:hypothetical protein